MSTNDYAMGYSQAIEDVARGAHNSALVRDYGLRLVPANEVDEYRRALEDIAGGAIKDAAYRAQTALKA